VTGNTMVDTVVVAGDFEEATCKSVFETGCVVVKVFCLVVTTAVVLSTSVLVRYFVLKLVFFSSLYYKTLLKFVML